MAFYDLNKTARYEKVRQITNDISGEIKTGKLVKTLAYFSDEDGYIRKAAYLAFGKIYKNDPLLLTEIVDILRIFIRVADFKVRQTAINAAGEIGKIDFPGVKEFFDIGLFDSHHSPRNAVIGSIKKMGEVNPAPVLSFAREYLHHPDKEIRREICHGIELRGRKYPQDILPLLKELQFDKTKRVQSTLVHVLGQIAYKKGCLAIVIAELKTWENSALAKAAIEEIIDVHHRYRDFSVLTQEEARRYIAENF